MKTETIIHDPNDQTQTIKARKVQWKALTEQFPRCAWCKITELKMLVEVVQRGFQWDFIEAICHCDSCNLATIVQFEAPLVAADEELQSEYN